MMARWPVVLLLLQAQVLQCSFLRTAPAPSASCAALLDRYCANETDPLLARCYKGMRDGLHGKVKIPLVAAFSGSEDGPTRAWRCYSPTALKQDPSATPLMQREFNRAAPGKGASAYCTDKSGQLLAQLHECDPDWKPPCQPGQRCPVTVFPGGGRPPQPSAHIPSLVFVPSIGGRNGTLIGFSETAGPCPHDSKQTCSLAARRSSDLGATWSADSYPASQATKIPTPGSHSHWCCPMSVFDPGSSTIILHFSNRTVIKGGCDIGESQPGGVLQIRSTDSGISWFGFTDIQLQIEFPQQPKNCMEPTSGAGLVMRPDHSGKYGGRLVFCPVRNAYQGDIPIWSDDHGRTFNYSTGLYMPGLDECNIAQAANGSLYLISRNCLEADINKCQMATSPLDEISRSFGNGDHHFVYSISNDGGETVRLTVIYC
eukprot:COSAG02_NODE_8364_length_2597_cov_1.446757_2_plen_429_part_00